MDWTEHVPQVPLGWLLERENPSVRARALTELLGHAPEGKEVVEARQMIAGAPDTAQILEGQHPDGHWGQPERYFRKHTGTAWRWLLLHELGMDPRDPQMLKAADFLLTEENVHTALVYGIVTDGGQESLVGSMRTSKITVDPDAFIKEVFGQDSDGHPFGGGKWSAGGFDIPVGFLSGGKGDEYLERKWQVYDARVRQGLFAKIGIKEQAE